MPADTLSQVVIVLIDAIVLVFGSTYIYAILKDGKGKFKSTNEIITFVLVSIETVWSFLLCIIHSILLAQGGFVGPFAQTLCLIDGIVLYTGVDLIVSCHCILAFERFVVMNNLFRMNKVILWSAFTLVFLSSAWLIPYQLFQVNPFVVSESGSFCFFPQVGTLQDRTGTIIQSIHGFIGLNLCINIYGFVYLKIQKASKEIGGASGKANEASLKSLKEVLWRCMALVGIMMVQWTPLLAASGYRVISNQKLPPVLSDFASFLVLTDGFISPIILMWSNKKQWSAYQKYVLRRDIVTGTSTKTSEKASGISTTPDQSMPKA